MNQSVDSPLSGFGTPLERVENALQALREGKGVLVADDENRENEGDLIYAAESLTEEQMAMLIRECSGIVCVCLTDDRVRELGLPMMVRDNQSPYQTAFTVSVEATRGVTTGVSAADRLRTVLACTTEEADPLAVRSPGHVFPLRACSGGVLERRGHTEATVDLMTLAGLRPFGVLCEVTNPDGTMARLPEIIEMGKRHNMPVLTVEDIVQYRMHQENTANSRESTAAERTAA